MAQFGEYSGRVATSANAFDFQDYGFDKNNRLLFFYSGHGYTRNNKGYIVPTDAPNPQLNEKSEKGFLKKAVGMNQILTWARRMEAKHALFLFDSCFSMAKLPVRQFITAGSADEEVPAKSVFTPAFIDALQYRLGDLYKDGYVTGEELGLYLKNKVHEHSEQTPQYGKIRDYDLSRGDFVFAVGSGTQLATDRSSSQIAIETAWPMRRISVLVIPRPKSQKAFINKALKQAVH